MNNSKNNEMKKHRNFILKKVYIRNIINVFKYLINKS